MMKPKLALTIIFILLEYSNGFAQWIQQVSGTNQQLWSIDFVDSNIGYANTDNGITIKTTDGGANWNLFPSFTGPYMEFISADTAFGLTVDTAMHLQKSTDGGLTWVTKSTSFDFGRIFFPSSNIGYVSGFTSDLDSMLFYRSTDAGETWNVVSGYYMLFSPFYGALYFSSSNTGYYTNDSGELYRTTNGGISWTVVYTTAGGEYISALDFPTSVIGYGATDNGFIKSTDGGLTWNQTVLPFTGSFQDIDCPNSNTCHMVGGASALLKTTDGGSNWTETVNPCAAFSDVDFVNDTIGYTCGLGGVIMKYGNGSSGIVEAEMIAVHLFPNPATTFTILQVEKSKNLFRTLQIFNCTGSLIRTIPNIQSEIIRLDLEDFSPGIYFVRIVLGTGQSGIQKLVIQ
jgi:photosystem II stability/assembly factor-like uncharacterized protein